MNMVMEKYVLEQALKKNKEKYGKYYKNEEYVETLKHKILMYM